MIPPAIYFEPLPTDIDRGSYRLTLRRRVGDVALYERWNRDLGRLSSFEIVRIHRAPASEVFGRPLPPREVYPSTSEWGLNGWTYQHEDGAIRKFETVAAAQEGAGAEIHAAPARDLAA